MALHESDTSDDAVEGNTATYCPEDNKIRIYCGRLHRESFETLRKAGYKSTPKQECAFVATWSIAAEDLAYELIPEWDDIGDEDYSPQERAADRADRFAGYRDKRAGEAHGFADRYDAGPTVFGNQNASRAEKQAARHDRLRGRAYDQWSKAEYWHARTDGVISHAQHRSDPETRRGRILTLEKEIRKIESYYTPCPKTPPIMQESYRNPQDGPIEHVWCGSGRGGYWTPTRSLEATKRSYARYIQHLQMRLIYENKMLENEGGKASEVEMVPGGWLGSHQIQKINRSAKTGRVVSVEVIGKYIDYELGKRVEKTGKVKFNIERLGSEIYRAPTEEELAVFHSKKKEAKEKRGVISTINPTDEDAQKLQDHWNTQAKARAAAKGKEVETIAIERMTQKRFSGWLKHGYVSLLRVTLAGKTMDLRVKRGGYWSSAANHVVILTDKPQKPLGIDWDALEVESVEVPTH